MHRKVDILGGLSGEDVLAALTERCRQAEDSWRVAICAASRMYQLCSSSTTTVLLYYYYCSYDRLVDVRRPECAGQTRNTKNQTRAGVYVIRYTFFPIWRSVIDKFGIRTVCTAERLSYRFPYERPLCFSPGERYLGRCQAPKSVEATTSLRQTCSALGSLRMACYCTSKATTTTIYPSKEQIDPDRPHHHRPLLCQNALRLLHPHRRGGQCEEEKHYMRSSFL